MRHFHDFSRKAGFDVEGYSLAYPDTAVSFEAASAWVAWLNMNELTAGTVASKVSHIRKECEAVGKAHPFATGRWAITMEAQARSKPQVVRKRKPVTPLILGTMFGYLAGWKTVGEWMIVLLLLAYAGMLRMGEAIGLRIGDLQFTEKGVRLAFEGRKNDPYRRGGSVWIARLEGCRWCPVARLEDHLRRTRGESWRERASETPVFQGQRQKDKVYKKEPTISFSTVYRHTEKTFIAIGLDPAEYGCHSCRVGGATAAHLRGLSDEDTAKHVRGVARSLHNARLPRARHGGTVTTFQGGGNMGNPRRVINIHAGTGGSWGTGGRREGCWGGLERECWWGLVGVLAGGRRLAKLRYRAPDGEAGIPQE
jgi:hypothetical protein